jgi:hypothetical protein
MTSPVHDGPPGAGFDPSVVPVRRPTDLQLEEDGQVAVYDPAAGLVVLNESAAAIWSHCDGWTSLGAIVDRLGRTFTTDPDHLRFDVWTTYLRLAELGLVGDARRRTVSSGSARGHLGRSG